MSNPARCSLALLLAACSGGAAAEGDRGPPPPAQVEVGHARSGALLRSRTYLGQVRSMARAELSAGSSGEVREVRVREGDRVEAGALLLVLDESLARAQLSAAQAASAATRSELEQAERDAERLGRAGERAVAGAEIERATARAETLAATRRGHGALAARARADLSRHRVLAPFAGVIARRMVDPGDWVSPGTAVLELVAHDSLEVEVRADAELLGTLRAGDAVTLRRGERTVPGSVRALVPALDPVTRTAHVRIAPDETPSWLLAGDTVDVLITTSGDTEGVIVPRDALVVGAVETRVVKVVGGRAVPLVVEIVDRGAHEVRVRAEGLAAGDVVVVRGNERLRADQALEVVD